MTQATRSTDSAPPSGPQPGMASQAALWLFGLTASTLVVSALLLLGVLAQSASAGSWLYGFVTAVALVVGVVGVAALAYVVLAAHRAGYLQLPAVQLGVKGATAQHSTAAQHGTAAEPSASTQPDHEAVARAGDPPPPSSGLRVVPAIPADLAARRRRELEQERRARANQARAIAVAEAAQRRMPPKPAVPAPPVQTRTVQLMRPVPSVRPTAGLAARRSTATIRTPQPVSRPTGVAPSLRLSMPPAHRQVRAAQLQLAVADLRSSRPGPGPASPRMPGRAMPRPLPFPSPMPARMMAPAPPPSRPQAPVPARPR